MHDAKSFLGGMFLAAAALGLMASLVAPMLTSTVAFPAAVASRAGPIIELVGSLIAGLAAVLWEHRRSR